MAKAPMSVKLPAPPPGMQVKKIKLKAKMVAKPAKDMR